MRFSLQKMLVVVAMIAIGCAGLMYHSAGWASIVVSVTIGLYAFMILRGVGQRAGSRAFSLGFAVAGIAYLLLASCSFFGSLRESLVTNYPLALAARSVGTRDPDFELDSSEDNPFEDRSPGLTTFSSNKYVIQGLPYPISVPSLDGVISLAMSNNPMPVSRFFLIGHCLWSWLFAWLAGWIAERRYVRRREVAQAQ
jgi:hypothetical protein